MKVVLKELLGCSIELCLIDAKILRVEGPRRPRAGEIMCDYFDVIVSKNYWDTLPEEEVSKNANRGEGVVSYRKNELTSKVLLAFGVDSVDGLAGKAVILAYRGGSISAEILDPREKVIFEK